MDNLEETYIDKLKDLALYWKYLHHELSIGDLAKSKKIPIKIIKEKLDLNGCLVKISSKTPADNSIIPFILNIKYLKKRSKRPKNRKSKVLGNLSPKPKNALLLKNWLIEDQKLKDIANTPKAILISTPMGGKVK